LSGCARTQAPNVTHMSNGRRDLLDHAKNLKPDPSDEQLWQAVSKLLSKHRPGIIRPEKTRKERLQKEGLRCTWPEVLARPFPHTPLRCAAASRAAAVAPVRHSSRSQRPPPPPLAPPALVWGRGCCPVLVGRADFFGAVITPRKK
jgi:hypothetical protein